MGQLLFTQKELILLTQTHGDIQVGAHEVKQGKLRGWELRIPYQDKKNQEPQHMTLVTARGNIRTFKNLDTTVDFIMKHCSQVRVSVFHLMEPMRTTRTRKSARTKASGEKIAVKEVKMVTKKTKLKRKPSLI